jgi:hypothetical protein
MRSPTTRTGKDLAAMVIGTEPGEPSRTLILP